MTRQKRKSVQEVAMGALDELRAQPAAGGDEGSVAELAGRQGPIADNPHPHRQIRRRLDPNRLRPWRFADRTDAEMDHIRELAESMRGDGQYQPIIVRSLAPDDSEDAYDYEVIAGQVRWRAALFAGLEVVDCVIKDVDDATAMRIMVSENELRRGISAISRARSLRAAIGPGGIYASQADAARALNMSKAMVTRYIQIAAIPPAVWEAFSAPHSTSLRLATAMGQAVADGYQAELVALASELERGAVTAEELQGALEAVRHHGVAQRGTDDSTPPAQLTGAAPGSTSPTSQPRVYATDTGQPYMTYKRTRSGAAIRIPAAVEKSLGEEEIDRLAEEIAQVVRRHLEQ